MKNVIVYYQRNFNPYAKYAVNFLKTHIKVFEGVIKDDEDVDTVFSVFSNDDTNPLSNSNTTNKVCIIGKDKFGTGADFQEAMKKGDVDCDHTTMSVGDIVDVDGTIYLCKDIGWKILNKQRKAA